MGHPGFGLDCEWDVFWVFRVGAGWAGGRRWRRSAGEDVEGVAREARGLDVRLVHGAGDGGAGDEVGAVFGEEDAFADGADGVAGAADALHAAGDGGWRLRSG